MNNYQNNDNSIKNHFTAEISKHPCFNKEASKNYGRVHLPVAKSCNISCNYCHRDYDCQNESRPGVTSSLLLPEEAVSRIYEVKRFFGDISVAAVAGPGDSLAEPLNTMKTFELVKNEFSDIILCMSTNGLNLSDNLEELLDKGVRFITVTLNAIDVSIASKIYRYVDYKNIIYTDKEAAEILLEKQIKGIESAVKMGFTIKINSVLIPGINDFHIKDISEKAKKLGVYLFNVMPMIPAKKSYFEKIGVKGAGRKDVTDITKDIEGINIMEHCRQCRSDAAGLLGEDLSGKLISEEGGLKCECKKTRF